LLHYVELLDARGLVDGWTSSADVERTKPDPDIILAGLERAGQKQAVPDRRLDLGLHRGEAREGADARRPHRRLLSREELDEAGAAAVFESLGELLERLDETTPRVLAILWRLARWR